MTRLSIKASATQLTEPTLDCGHRSYRAVGSDLVVNWHNLTGLLGGPRQNIYIAEVDKHLLCVGRDDRRVGAHKDVSGRRARRGDVQHGGLTGTKTLEHLTHGQILGIGAGPHDSLE
jgi:hypothetical protein